MSTIIILAIVLIALSFVANAANDIYSTISSRKKSKKVESANPFAELIGAAMLSKSGDYLVTKEWYDGHKSSEIVSANSPKDAFSKQSDDKRNLEYYISSVIKL